MQIENRPVTVETPLVQPDIHLTEHQAKPAEPASPAPKIHLGYLDGLRALAALYIVMNHAYLQEHGLFKELPGLLRKALFLLEPGHLSVTVFIVLSGFCLMLPVTRAGTLKNGALNFFKKRARRILPPYYLAVGVSLLLIYTLIGQPTGSHWDKSIPVTTRDLIFHALLIQDTLFHTANKINHPLWSISVEWRIYFLFPLLIVLFRKLGGVLTTLLTAAVFFPIQIALQHVLIGGVQLNYGPGGMCLHYVVMFTIGMLACDVAFSKPEVYPKLQRMPWTKIAPFATLGLIAYFVLGKGLLFLFDDVAVGLWVFCLLISLSRGEGQLSKRILSWKPIVFLGTFAYSIYLTHAFTLQLVTQYAVRPLHLAPTPTVLLTILVGTLISIPVAYLFFLFAERPFLNTKAVK